MKSKTNNAPGGTTTLENTVYFDERSEDIGRGTATARYFNTIQQQEFELPRTTLGGFSNKHRRLRTAHVSPQQSTLDIANPKQITWAPVSENQDDLTVNVGISSEPNLQAPTHPTSGPILFDDFKQMSGPMSVKSARIGSARVSGRRSIKLRDKDSSSMP